MKIAWNWLGITAWIVIGLYFIWTIYSMHLLSHQTVNDKRHHFLFRKTTLFTILRLIVLLVAACGMLFLHYHKDSNNEYASIKRSYQSIVLDTNGDHSYYVKIQKQRGGLSLRTYSYLTNGKREFVSSSNALLYHDKYVKELPSLYSTPKSKLTYLDQRYQRAWLIQVVTKYKNNWWNGLSFHANRVAGRHVLLRVPDQSFIYNEK